ncbi:MAG TPA: hypothetical protein VG244_02605 [Acidimicrobiales bacterium]|nr:hypothetical protein [Acidimicrobiales bacterium]
MEPPAYDTDPGAFDPSQPLTETERVRRGKGISAVICTFVVLGTLVPLASIPTGAAATTMPTLPIPADANGIVYPLTSFLDWAENPLENITDPALGENALTQILQNAAAAVGQQFRGEIAAAFSANPGTAALNLSEQMAAELVHLRPVVAGDDVTDVANPNFLPDFDHNGVFGDPSDFVAMEQGAQGPAGLGSPSSHPATGAFLYPCIADSGAVTYQTTTNTCAPSASPHTTYKTGVAEQETIIDSRGLSLAATLWLPGAAVDPTTAHAHNFPAVVISDGIASDQSDYFWLAMSLAAQGDIVLTYDPAGQGASEGSAANLFSPSTAGCIFAGACRDLEDAVRWLLDDPIIPAVDLADSTPVFPLTSDVTPPNQAAAAVAGNPDLHNPDPAPAGANVPDPAFALINPSKVAVAGHSMGALSLLNYVAFQSKGSDGADGQPLPPLATGVSLSGAAPTAAIVPIQFQTSDFDGSPTLVGPAVGGIDFGGAGSGIGYEQIKPLYDQLRASGPGTSALSLVVLEGGVHTDFIDTPFITRTPWALAVSAHYATAWLGCFLQGVGPDCLTASLPAAHLSSSFASEITPPGGPLPRTSHCITVPTTASLSETPPQFGAAFFGHPGYDCTP